jgi:hypothetical protein
MFSDGEWSLLHVLQTIDINAVDADKITVAFDEDSRDQIDYDQWTDAVIG